VQNRSSSLKEKFTFKVEIGKGFTIDVQIPVLNSQPEIWVTAQYWFCFENKSGRLKVIPSWTTT